MSVADPETEGEPMRAVEATRLRQPPRPRGARRRRPHGHGGARPPRRPLGAGGGGAVQRLERAGVIAGYRAELDPRALGFPVAVVVRIRPAPGQLQRIPEIAQTTREVAECHRITGEDCYLLRVHLRSIDELEDVLDRFTPYGLTTTSIVHSTPVPRRNPPLG
jgi:Lrp/AsnC family leucine-responsive transcriptional regulator